jgi:hypothetical protein
VCQHTSLIFILLFNIYFRGERTGGF